MCKEPITYTLSKMASLSKTWTKKLTKAEGQAFYAAAPLPWRQQSFATQQRVWAGSLTPF